jgi:hypothetical protein
MLAALIAFFSSMTVVRSDGGRLGLSIAWTAFVGVWVWWLRYGKRVQPGRTQVPPAMRHQLVREWIILFVAVNAIAYTMSRISWALVGVLEAIVIGGYAAVASRRGRRT